MTAQRVGRVKQPHPVALVTGGAVRVGRAIALALGREGMRVAIGYLRSAAAARSAVRELTAVGVEAIAVRADLRSPAEARRLVSETAQRFGRLDLLVNNAAVFFATPLATTTSGQYDLLLDLNLRGAFFCAQAAARRMRAGRIVNVGDAGVARPWPRHIPYALSKAGIVALTRGLAAALAPRIAVNCVAPGPVLRPPGVPRADWRRMRRERAASPEDVAAAVVFFATCPRAITGQVLAVGGE
jgi:NAD(P)-dependent dehydrogenase (short-subunit alcohol dehydrogenase family)